MTGMNAHVFLSALLSLLSGTDARHRCIEARRGTIEAQADEAARRYSVPVEVLLAVAYMESHIGCAPRSGACWGAPISPTRRGVAGGASHAASALALGYRRCETMEGAIAHFRYGLCRTPARHSTGYTPADAIRLIERMTARAQRATP